MSPEENEAESPAVRDEPSEGRQSGRKPWPPEHWPPEARDLVIRSGMSPAQVEAWWAKGSGIGELSGEDQPTPPPANTSRPGSGDYKKPPPPRLFTDVARRLGFDPLNERPRDAHPIPPGVDLPEDRPPDFWDPREDGGFDEAIIRPGLPNPEELGIEPLEDEEWRAPDPERWHEPGSPHGYTPDTIAYYLPWHIGGHKHWGIYFRVPRMNRYIERIQREFGPGISTEQIIDQVFWHEMEHFEQELAATALEDLLDQILFPQWLEERHQIPVDLLDRRSGQVTEVWMIEEALATAREIEEVEKPRRKHGKHPLGYVDFLKCDSLSKPTGYNRFFLCLGEEARREARAAFLESVASVASISQPPSSGRFSPETANRLFGRRTPGRKKVPVYSVLPTKPY